MAVTTPEVAAARVLACEVEAVPLLTETASLSRPVIPPDAYAVIRSEALPVSVVTVLALTVPEVWPSRVLRTATARDVSLRVTASLPRLLMPAES